MNQDAQRWPHVDASSSLSFQKINRCFDQQNMHTLQDFPSGEQQSFRKSLACLSDAAQAFALELDSRKLFQSIAAHAAKLVAAERVVTYVVDEQKIEREGWYPTSDPQWPPQGPLPKELARMLSRPEPVLSRLHAARADSAHNAMFIPLLGTQNRLLGLIELRRKRWGGIFSESDLDVAVALARVATAAVDRTRLFHRMVEWSKSMEMLLSFNAAVNQHLQPTELVRQLLVNAAGFVDACGGAAGLSIQHEHAPAMVTESCYFNGNWYPFERRWLARQGVAGTVLETEFPLLLADYAASELADRELRHRFNIGPCVCVPIKNAEQSVMGFFKLFRATGQSEFTWQEAALLESLGNTAAVAIENARLVKSLELKNEQIKKLSAANVRRLEEERQHIARELHDETGQVLIGLKLRLQLLSKRLQADQVTAKADLNLLRDQVNQAAVRLNGLAKRLRPPTLDELGFEATLRQLIGDFRNQFNLPIQLEIATEQRLTQEAETTLYRIVQEGLTNVIKHANATRIMIRLHEQPTGLALDIEDNGCGFNVDDPQAGLGLIGIQERMMMLGGEVTIQSQTGHGTALRVRRIPTK
ncbi:MAG TPA: GAF domain-containing sensor histidine kinase [Pirellulaceae bacterium]|nr:GAF domain-containing sensor histidine kinase [Pirellulaceae bacterium]HMO90684.1 GAF domain-containing sensor histidine kinase [Pirellulaceae bacterium]HMP67737.1 GAF domain-containing sensor histidine kinase [Pirellulaceae bacterium]